MLKKRAVSTDYNKACTNSTIGAFKPNLIKHSKWSYTIITSCKLKVLRNARENMSNLLILFGIMMIIFFIIFLSHKVSNVETERPLHDQRVQQEIIEQHKLKNEIKGGKITDLHTDAITCTLSDDKCPFDLIDDKKYAFTAVCVARYLYSACDADRAPCHLALSCAPGEVLHRRKVSHPSTSRLRWATLVWWSG
jgi:hypothetical protein